MNFPGRRGGGTQTPSFSSATTKILSTGDVSWGFWFVVTAVIVIFVLGFGALIAFVPTTKEPEQPLKPVGPGGNGGGGGGGGGNGGGGLNDGGNHGGGGQGSGQACTKNSDCASFRDKPYCNKLTGQCSCGTNIAQCGGKTPYCSMGGGPGEGQCVECFDFADCKAGQSCNASTNKCVSNGPHCSVDNTCPRGYYCDITDGYCHQECRDTADCDMAHGQVCNQEYGFCYVAQCTSDADCNTSGDPSSESGTYKCNTQTGKCYKDQQQQPPNGPVQPNNGFADECSVDSDCQAGWSCQTSAANGGYLACVKQQPADQCSTDADCQSGYSCQVSSSGIKSCVQQQTPNDGPQKPQCQNCGYFGCSSESGQCYTSCSSNDQCSTGAVCNTVSGNCVKACDDGANHCPDGYYCGSDKLCVQDCTVDKPCTDPNTFCNLQIGQCQTQNTGPQKPCNDINPCPTGYYCGSGLVCAQDCSASNPCADANLSCNLNTGQCQTRGSQPQSGCAADVDCQKNLTGQHCLLPNGATSGGRCGCVTNDQCLNTADGAAQYCSTATNTCVQCQTDADCADPLTVCSPTGTCVSKVSDDSRDGGWYIGIAVSLGLIVLVAFIALGLWYFGIFGNGKPLVMFGSDTKVIVDRDNPGGTPDIGGTATPGASAIELLPTDTKKPGTAVTSGTPETTETSNFLQSVRGIPRSIRNRISSWVTSSDDSKQSETRTTKIPKTEKLFKKFLECDALLYFVIIRVNTTTNKADITMRLYDLTAITAPLIFGTPKRALYLQFQERNDMRVDVDSLETLMRFAEYLCTGTETGIIPDNLTKLKQRYDDEKIARSKARSSLPSATGTSPPPLSSAAPKIVVTPAKKQKPTSPSSTSPIPTSPSSTSPIPTHEVKYVFENEPGREKLSPYYIGKFDMHTRKPSYLQKLSELNDFDARDMFDSDGFYVGLQYSDNSNPDIVVQVPNLDQLKVYAKYLITGSGPGEIPRHLIEIRAKANTGSNVSAPADSSIGSSIESEPPKLASYTDGSKYEIQILGPGDQRREIYPIREIGNIAIQLNNPELTASLRVKDRPELGDIRYNRDTYNELVKDSQYLLNGHEYEGIQDDIKQLRAAAEGV